MKWLTLDYIRQHSRIDYDLEDNLLEMYARSAEDTVLSLCNRSYDDLIDQYGEVPAPLYHAALMLVDLSYWQRSPVSAQNLARIPYTFDILVKPYMRL